MILADKIIDLRKKNGWSQEDLASQLGVSRQSVSKWESAASIPDLDKIIKLADIFGVSTDYLLKDSIDPEPIEIEENKSSLDGYSINSNSYDTQPPIVISLEETNTYLETVRSCNGKIALGVMLCILSPVVLIFLGGLSSEEGGYAISESLASGLGVAVLLLIVAIAVSIFIFFGKKLEAYDFLEKSPIELSYGVDGIVKKQKAAYEDTYKMSLITGVFLCIVSTIPIILAAVFEENGFLTIIGVNLCLTLVAIGVFIIVKTCILYGAFQRLLEEGDYTRNKKAEAGNDELIATIYWCSIVAIFLAWSFYTDDWHRTWIIWPCAGVLFAAFCGIVALIRKTKH